MPFGREIKCCITEDVFPPACSQRLTTRSALRFTSSFFLLHKTANLLARRHRQMLMDSFVKNPLLIYSPPPLPLLLLEEKIQWPKSKYRFACPSGCESFHKSSTGKDIAVNTECGSTWQLHSPVFFLNLAMPYSWNVELITFTVTLTRNNHIIEHYIYSWQLAHFFC